MNIRTRKSNHRAVNAGSNNNDESYEPLSYFLPLLKEKKGAVRINALKNIIDICTFQNRIEELHEFEENQFIDAVCTILTSGKELEEQKLAVHAVQLLSIMNGTHTHGFYKHVKGFLSPFITDGEDHHDAVVVAGALEALGATCFMNCSEPDSFDHTIEFIADVIRTEKNKTILISALKAWSLLLTKLDKSKINKHLELLDRIVEISSNANNELQLTCATTIAFLVSEMDSSPILNEAEEVGEDDDDEEYDGEGEEDEEGEAAYHNHHNGNGNGHVNGQSDSDEEEQDEEEEEEDYDENDEDYDEEDADDNEIIKLVEDILLNNNEKTKIKIQSNTVLRRVLKTLKLGETPRETLTVTDSTYFLEGWRSYIQLHQMKKILKNGTTFQWALNKDLRSQFNADVKVHSKMTDLERRMYMSPSSNKSKQRTQSLKKDRRQTSMVYNYHHQDE